MKIIVFCLVLLLSGCSVFNRFVPVKPPQFPEAIPELTKKCDDLKQATGTTLSITDLLKIVVANYTLYYECSNKVDGWNDWYIKQKEIYEKTRK